MGLLELSLATVLLPKGVGESEVRVQNLNTIVTGQSVHIQGVITSIEHNASGIGKL